ncbi:cyclic nucleotide-binding domain-containing protein [Candidatus Poribacteria bacterium]|nr:cyclic nucleotide-binding domain-containing protein [Candidatus Poribacteria bacterium]
MKNLVTEHFWYVKQIHVFRDLSEEDARVLAQIVTFKNLKHEERIREEGVYLIKEGRVKISENLSDADSEKVEKRSKNSDSNEKQDPETKDVLEPGEIFGVISDEGVLNENRTTFAETLTEVWLGTATIRDFSFFLKRKPHLALPLPRRRQLGFSNVFGASTNPFLRYNRNKKQEEQLNSRSILKTSAAPDCKRANAFRNIMFRSASSCLALLLQNLALTPDRNGVVFVPRLPIRRISRLIGSSTETTETLLKTFKQHNVIDTRRGQIQILNPWQLKKIAVARMKTLSPPEVLVTASDDDIDLEKLINFQEDARTEPRSAGPSV